MGQRSVKDVVLDLNSKQPTLCRFGSLMLRHHFQLLLI